MKEENYLANHSLVQRVQARSAGQPIRTQKKGALTKEVGQVSLQGHPNGGDGI